VLADFVSDYLAKRGSAAMQRGGAARRGSAAGQRADKDINELIERSARSQNNAIEVR
tara:strand:- start:7720 stop:7890 length:171 start_codon:yes stop_codon:yes gene_type:complete